MKCWEPVSKLINISPTSPPPDKPPPAVGKTELTSPAPASIIFASTYALTAPAFPSTSGLPSSIELDTW